MNIHNTARILAKHQRSLVDGSCICREWPVAGVLEPWTLHVAKVLHPEPTPEPWAHPDTQIGRLNR